MAIDNKFFKGRSGYQIFNLQGVVLPRVKDAKSTAIPGIFSALKQFKGQGALPVLFVNFQISGFPGASAGSIYVPLVSETAARLMIMGCVYYVLADNTLVCENVPTTPAPAMATAPAKAPAQAETPVEAKLEGGNSNENKHS